MQDPAKPMDAAIPLERMARPVQIAAVVSLLAGDAASHLTATTTDGGVEASSLGL
jgi:hypothetical protein